MRRSFTVLLNSEMEFTYFPQNHVPDVDEVHGHHPWEFVIPEDKEIIEESFLRAMRDGEEDFHIVHILDDAPNYQGCRLCAWVWPIKNPRNCPHACVAIMVNCVIVPDLFEELTERERDVLVLLAEGKSPRVIAEEMSLAPTTIHTYLSRVREKLELEDLVQVAAWAVTYRDILSLKEL